MREVLEWGARTVLDLGCGTGELLQRLAREPQLTRIVGVEIDRNACDAARLALGLGFPSTADRVQVRGGSYEDVDVSLVGFDAVVMVETIEHVDPSRLSRVERAVFGGMRPGLVLITTPNQEYNVLHGMAPGELRHRGHRFEWCRAKFRSWSQGVADRAGYAVTFGAIGPPDRLRGSSTQTARFVRQG